MQQQGYGAYATLLRKTMGAKKLDGEPNTPTFVKLVQNDQNGVAVGWEVEPSSQYAILFSAPGGGGGGGDGGGGGSGGGRRRRRRRCFFFFVFFWGGGWFCRRIP